MIEHHEHAGDFLELTRKISVERGFGCASYKEKCLRRRIAVRMRARGVHTYGDYARVLDADASEYDRLLDALTINVTKLFRNWEVYASMAANVVPALWYRQTPRIRVWSAGCSSGDEPYSLAILFHRFASVNGMLPQIGRVSVLGTDIDRQCLDAAALGHFEEADFADTPAELRQRYFAASEPFAVSAAIRDLVRFQSRDLLSEAPPTGPFDLITCRNVLIYFDRETQESLFETFYHALAPDGFLVLGKVETILGRYRSRFAPVDSRGRDLSPPMSAEPSDIRVCVADYAVSARGMISTIGLGSCVAIVLHDAAARVGGLAHVLLPSSSMSHDRSNPAKFPETAVPLLLGEMGRLGARRERMTARIVGGASMFANLIPSGSINIGERNVVAVRDVLSQAKLPIVGEDVGSDYGRSVYFFTCDGRVEVRSLRKGSRVL